MEIIPSTSANMTENFEIVRKGVRDETLWNGG